MEAYLSGKTENGWWLCLYGENIVAGLGVIDNDFHDRKDLTPNVCAVYTEEEHRKKGLAGKLLNKVVDDMANKGVATLYLVTDHIQRLARINSNNINQIAKHANETGAVYKSDVEELTAGQKEIQKLLRGIFSELAKIQ